MSGVRVEFRLTMPSRGSWDDGWSGAGRNYVRVRQMTLHQALALTGGQTEHTWYHRWSDGWCASVTARLMEPRERRSKSDGFCGYDLMIDNVLTHGDTRKPGEAAS